MRYILLVIFLNIIVVPGCRNKTSSGTKEVIIFHAGSLSIPFRELAKVYEQKNPGIKVLLEPAGSIVCARKITELKRPCDIMASADHAVINNLLIPDHTDWGISFATNEMVLSYTDKSPLASEINSDNWFDIISSEKVVYSRSDPDSDPGGYRAVLTIKLAEKYYGRNGLTEKLLKKDKNYIRPKEVDLIALLESSAVDYVFIYRSVAVQHKLKYISLPPEINLSDRHFDSLYNTVSLEVAGSSPRSKMKVSGEYIIYSLTVLRDAPLKEEALDFVEFIISNEGMDILRKNGQNPIIPLFTEQPDKIPARLLLYLNQDKPETVI